MNENEKITPEGTPVEKDNQLEKCRQEREEYLAGWQRAKADFINYKKEEAKRFEEIAKYANAVLLEELVTVLDNFDMAIQAFQKTGPVDKGIYMIRAHLEDVLRKRGLARIEFSPPVPFDANTMETIEAVDSPEPAGTVLEEVAPGYRLHDKILRPARVRVSRGTTKT